MRFSELEPAFLKITEELVYTRVDTVVEADGVSFLCPKCFVQNGGPRGTHSVLCWQPKVPLSPTKMGPGRWELRGTSFEDLSLVALPTSVLLEGGCNAHFIVENGDVRFA
jgi:hypothetical protein